MLLLIEGRARRRDIVLRFDLSTSLDTKKDGGRGPLKSRAENRDGHIPGPCRKCGGRGSARSDGALAGKRCCTSAGASTPGHPGARCRKRAGCAQCCKCNACTHCREARTRLPGAITRFVADQRVRQGDTKRCAPAPEESTARGCAGQRHSERERARWLRDGE